MPSKPMKPCAYPGCPALVTGRYCEEHTRKTNSDYEKFSMTAIRELTLPKSVTSVGNLTIAGCSNFERMIFTSEQPPLLVRYTLGVGYFFSDDDVNGKIVVPEDRKQQYIEDWKYYAIGYMKDEVKDAGVTEEQILEGENIVRGYLGMEPVAKNSTDEVTKPATENAQNAAIPVIIEESTTSASTTETGTTQSTEVPTEATTETTTEEPIATTQQAIDQSDTEQSTQEEDTEEQP